PPLQVFSELESTNAEAQRQAGQAAPEWTTIFAEQQTAGRGRLNRKWDSPAGLGLYVSVILLPEIEPQRINLINLTFALAAAEFLEYHLQITSSDKKVGLKWPNDLWIDHKKIGGILLESVFNNKKIEYLIIGIGLNLNQQITDFAPDLQDRSVSLCQLCGIHYNPVQICPEFVRRVYRRYQQESATNFMNVTEQYQERLLFKNEVVSIRSGAASQTGRIIGVNPQGFLQLRNNGRDEIITAGDIWEFKEDGK
ncbi:MAG: biotin--[acetyl-CoA-carboxylase] ligase, partial [Calditrichia bacterium]